MGGIRGVKQEKREAEATEAEVQRLSRMGPAAARAWVEKSLKWDQP